MKIRRWMKLIIFSLCITMAGSVTGVARAAENGGRKIQQYTLHDTNDGELSVTMISRPSNAAGSGETDGNATDAVGKIPSIYIDTYDGQKITSRDEYKGATVTIDNSCGLKVENGTAGSRDMSDTLIATSEPITTYEVGIRGRGNASWLQFPQKSYLLKFEEKLSLFGMTRSKKYVLQPCYIDDSLIRNNVAMSMGTVLTNLEYVPGNLPVNVYLNGQYIGLYSFSEKVEEGLEKVNLFSEYSYEELQTMGETKTPFILECGPYSQGKEYYSEMTYVEGLDYIFVTGNERLLIEYPEITKEFSPEVYEIKEQIDAMGLSICSLKDYEQYLDVDEWVDWFIMIELTGNADAAIHRSTYFYRRPGDTVKIGPIWDYDTAFGHDVNDAKDHDRWVSAETTLVAVKNTWMVKLYQDDDFMLAVRERWDEVKDDLLAEAKDAVSYYGELVEDSIDAHNQAQNRYASKAGAQEIITYLEARYAWINQSIHQEDFNRNPYIPSDDELFDGNGSIHPNEEAELTEETDESSDAVNQVEINESK